MKKRSTVAVFMLHHDETRQRQNNSTLSLCGASWMDEQYFSEKVRNIVSNNYIKVFVYKLSCHNWCKINFGYSLNSYHYVRQCSQCVLYHLYFVIY